jgi:protein-tyrosine phosphatase
MKILFVCLGNICRSPVAEAIFKHKIKEKDLQNHFIADSCGTANYHVGDLPDHRSIRNTGKNGVQIDHLGRQLKEADLDNFDLVLAMDESNRRNILLLSNASLNKEKIKLMREFDPLGDGDVPDPYYGGEKDFQLVFDILHRSIENLIDAIKDK